MIRILCLLIGYCFGCIQSAYVVGRICQVDLRTRGSGNLGFSNTLRVLGKKMGILVFFIDVGKAMAAVFLCHALFPSWIAAAFYGGFGAVLGHDFPFYLKFKGGKGIASMIGLIASVSILYYPLGVVFCALAGCLPLLSGYISVGSLCFCVCLPLVMLGYKAPTEVVLICVALGVLGAYQHRANIKRLLNGTENRFGKKGKKA